MAAWRPRSETWTEPSAALIAAAQEVGWTIRRNKECLRALRWPAVDPELSYPGKVLLVPVKSFPEALAVFTDGSVCKAGGAAAVCPDKEETRLATIAAPLIASWWPSASPWRQARRRF